MRENQHDQATVSFPAWKHHLEQVAEPRLQNALQQFVRLLGAVGTPLSGGLSVYVAYYHLKAR